MRPELSAHRSKRTFCMRFEQKDFYQLLPGLNDSPDPWWTPVTHASSLCSHTGQYIMTLSSLQPSLLFSQINSCRCNDGMEEIIKWNCHTSKSPVMFEHTFTPYHKCRQCHEEQGLGTQMSGRMTEQTETETETAINHLCNHIIKL